jgi:hypothetical protein
LENLVDGEMRNAYRILVKMPEGKRSLGKLGVDERIILKLILQEQNVKMWSEFNWLRIVYIGDLL